MRYQAWLDQYVETIVPLRKVADSGDGSYDQYDQQYNEHLESLHQMVQDDVAVLDAAVSQEVAKDGLLEWEVVWQLCPHVANPRRVSYVMAATQAAAKTLCRDHAKRTTGCDWLTIHAAKQTVELPVGVVR